MTESVYERPPNPNTNKGIQMQFENSPLSLFLYALKSSESKRQYPARLKKFFDFIPIETTYDIKDKDDPKNALNEQSIVFLKNAKDNENWVLNAILSFIEHLKSKQRKGQITIWDSLESYATNPSTSCITEPGDIGACNIMLSFAYETCKGVPSLTGCSANKNAIDSYISANNLMSKTNEYAYEFLEIVSALYNPSPTNTVDDMIYFSGSSDRGDVAFIEGYVGVRG